MATSVATAAEIYSDQVIKELQKVLAKLRAFSLNLTSEFKATGETVKVPLTGPDTVGTWDATSNNFKRSGATLKEVSISLNDKLITGFAITPAQLKQFKPNWWKSKAENNVPEIVDTILTGIAGIVTDAKYGSTANDRINVALGEFGIKSLAPLRAQMVKQKDLKPARSCLVLNPDYYSALLGDMPGQFWVSEETIASGVVPGLLGFRAIVELPQLTTPGFVCHPDAIAVGSAIEELPSAKPYDLVEVIEEPETGLSLQHVIYTDGSDGSMSDSINGVVGYGVGNSSALIRLVEAKA
jgi:hypothetical protein